MQTHSSDVPDRTGALLWQPPTERVRAAQMSAFADAVGIGAGDPVALHRWSLEQPERFWGELWRHLVPTVALDGPALVRGDTMVDATWFGDLRLNVAERILAGDCDASGRAVPDDDVMFVGLDELGRRRELSRGAAREQVAAIAAALSSAGVGVGDRVAAWMPNCIETMLVMLGAASIGAVFSSCSPDFGADGVLDRFGQIEPKVLVACDGYRYGGRSHVRLGELAAIAQGLPTLGRVVVFGFLDEQPDLDAAGLGTAGRAGDAELIGWGDWLAPHVGAEPVFAQLGFDHPWYVLYSSGTTGVPKCIVHRSGGVLLQHLKEQRLHLDIRRDDAVSYFTTAGWMMWNWLASVPATGARIVLYDGNPFHPGPERLWQLAAQEQLALLGVSAKYLDAVRQSGTVPHLVADLSHLRTLASTGSPLSPECFEWVMEAVAPGVGADGLHLASISGGTDLCGCFVGGDPTRPVHVGEIQGPALGMAVDVVRDDGTPCEPGERGELVCTQAFPSMPLGFWGDGPLGDVGPRYHAAYFERIPGIWAQGDFATWTSHGGMVIHGRSDTTLNPGGVRIGTAEIYRQVESVPEVLESLVFGQEVDNDVRIVLLVRLAEGTALDDELVSSIRTRVRQGCTPRHVPALVVQVDDLPRTRSGKLAELAVADQVNGREVRNTTALANPESLEHIARAVGDSG